MQQPAWAQPPQVLLEVLPPRPPHCSSFQQGHGFQKGHFPGHPPGDMGKSGPLFSWVFILPATSFKVFLILGLLHPMSCLGRGKAEDLKVEQYKKSHGAPHFFYPLLRFLGNTYLSTCLVLSFC